MEDLNENEINKKIIEMTKEIDNLNQLLVAIRAKKINQNNIKNYYF